MAVPSQEYTVSCRQGKEVLQQIQLSNKSCAHYRNWHRWPLCAGNTGDELWSVNMFFRNHNVKILQCCQCYSYLQRFMQMHQTQYATPLWFLVIGESLSSGYLPVQKDVYVDNSIHTALLERQVIVHMKFVFKLDGNEVTKMLKETYSELANDLGIVHQPYIIKPNNYIASQLSILVCWGVCGGFFQFQ